MPTFEAIVDRFRGRDRTTKLETLLAYSRRLHPLPPALEAAKAVGDHRVHECQTPVYLWVGLRDGGVSLHADAPPESPTVRGFLAILQAGVEGQPAAVADTIPDDLVDRLELGGDLGMTRMQGLGAIVARVKREIREAGAAANGG